MYIFSPGDWSTRLYIVYILVASFTLLCIPISLWIRKYRSPALGNAFYLASLLPSLVFLWDIGKRNLYTDFYQAYYIAGRSILSGTLNNLYICDTSVSGFVNIPIIAYLFTPISTLGGFEINLVLAISSVLAILLSLWLLFTLANMKYENKLWVGALFALNGPLFYSIKIGNSTHFLLLPLIFSLFCFAQSKRNFLAGTILGFLALMKIPFGLFAIYFLLRKNWQAFFGFASAIISLALLSVILLGPDINLEWINDCIIGYMGKPMAGFNTQSVDSFWARIFTSDRLYDWTPLTLGLAFKLARNLSIILLLGGIIWQLWKVGPPTKFETKSAEFCIMLCLAFMLSPVAWTYYYLYMLIPISLYIGRCLPQPSRKWQVILAIAVLLISLPVLRTNLSGLKGILHYNLFVSHYLVGGLLLLLVLLSSRSRQAKRKAAQN
jgi:hypothetical protein